MVKVAPSILAADFEYLEDEIKGVVEAGADMIHVDVMDGAFVENRTPGIEMFVKTKETTNIPADVHLMVENPESWIDKIIELHSNDKYSQDDIVTFHIEAVNEMIAYQLIEKLHSNGLKAGISVKPDTSSMEIIPFLPLVDLILVMTVEPGYGGQKMKESCLDKVKFIRSLDSDIDIEVDGGVNIVTAVKAKNAGANVLVAGTAIFKADNPKEVIEKLRE